MNDLIQFNSGSLQSPWPLLPQLPWGESESIESGSPLETATPCQEDGAMENGLDGKTPENTVQVEDIWESPSHKAGAQGSTRPSQASVPEEDEKPNKKAASTSTKNLRPNDPSHSETQAHETGHQMQHTRTSLESKAPVERHDDDVWESSGQRAQGAQGSTRPSQASLPGEDKAASTLTKNLYAKYAARSEATADETGYQLQHTRTSLTSKAAVERHDNDVWESPGQRAQGAQGSTRPSQASLPGEDSKQAASTLTKNLYAKYAARSEATADETGYQLQHTRTSLASKAPVERHDDDVWESPGQRAQGAQGSTRPSQASLPGEDKAASTLTKNLYAKYAARSEATADETGYQLQHTRTSLASKAPVERHDDDVWESSGQRAQGAQGSTRPSQASLPGEDKAASTLTKNLYAKYAARSEATADETGYQLQHTRTSLTSKAAVERHDNDVWESPGQRAQGAQGSTRPSQASLPGEDSKQAASTLTKNLYAKYAARSEATADETGYQLQHTRTSLTSKAAVEWDDDDAWESPSQRAQGTTVADAACQRTSVARKSAPGDAEFDQEPPRRAEQGSTAAEVDEAASEDEVFTKELLGVKKIHYSSSMVIDDTEVLLQNDDHDDHLRKRRFASLNWGSLFSSWAFSRSCSKTMKAFRVMALNLAKAMGRVVQDGWFGGGAAGWFWTLRWKSSTAKQATWTTIQHFQHLQAKGWA